MRNIVRNWLTEKAKWTYTDVNICNAGKSDAAIDAVLDLLHLPGTWLAVHWKARSKERQCLDMSKRLFPTRGWRDHLFDTFRSCLLHWVQGRKTPDQDGNQSSLQLWQSANKSLLPPWHFIRPKWDRLKMLSKQTIISSNLFTVPFSSSHNYNRDTSAHSKEKTRLWHSGVDGAVQHLNQNIAAGVFAFDSPETYLTYPFVWTWSITQGANKSRANIPVFVNLEGSWPGFLVFYASVQKMSWWKVANVFGKEEGWSSHKKWSYASKRVSKATIKQKLIEIESGFPAISS